MSPSSTLPSPGAVLITAFIWTHILAEESGRLPQGTLTIVQIALIRSVFRLDADGTGIPRVGEGGEESAPAHITQPGQFRRMVVERHGQDPDFVELAAVEPGIFGMDMMQAPRELGDGGYLVHALPDQVGGVVVETEVRIRNRVEH